MIESIEATRMLEKRIDCQDSCIRHASAHIPRAEVLVMRTMEHVRRFGIVHSMRKILLFARLRVDKALRRESAVIKAEIPEDVLGLEPGDLVEVKSENEIRSTLDSLDRTRGLGFMPGMARYCGKTFRVYKKVRMIILEGSGEVRHLKHTVLLNGVICDGEHFVCDRSCFYFWKEAWLRRLSVDYVNQPHDNDRFI